MYEIEKGIPMPDGYGGRSKIKALIGAMEVGDSFLVPLERRNSLHPYFGLFKPKKFTVRKQEDGTIRVWRKA